MKAVATEVNHVILSGCIEEISEIRFTPAGIAQLQLILHHQSQQTEGDDVSQVECKIGIQILGNNAEHLKSKLSLGSTIQVHGYLIRNNYRNEKSWVKIRAQKIEILPGFKN